MPLKGNYELELSYGEIGSLINNNVKKSLEIFVVDDIKHGGLARKIKLDLTIIRESEETREIREMSSNRSLK